MKKTILRKIAAITLALAVAMTMGVSVFAQSGSGTNLGTDESINPDKEGVVSNGGVREDGEDSGDTDSDGKHTHGTFQGVGNTVTLDKEIVIFNTKNNTVVYLPNIKYEYAVEAVDVADSKYITDEYKNKGAVNDGVAGAINNSGTPFVQFSNGQVGDAGISGTGMTAVTTPYVTAGTTGVAAEGHFNLTFNPGAFNKPGVYRYKVTESVASGFTKPSAGVIDNETYNADRYLDVYVQNKDGGGYEIYGYVLFEATDKDTEFTANPGTAITAKTNGFVSEVNDGDESAYSKTEVGVDIYETSNVKISKTITGVMADKNNGFPFEAFFKNSTITNKPVICYIKGSETTSASSNPTTMTDGEATIGAAASGGPVTLKDGEYIYVYGIPGRETANSTGSTTVLTKEYNNTSEVYTVSATYDATAKDVKSGSDSGTSVAMEAAATGEFVKAQTVLITKEKDEVVVTNNLNAISPTNVVTRYAPFVLILAAAILLLVVRRRRSSEEA